MIVWFTRSYQVWWPWPILMDRGEFEKWFPCFECESFEHLLSLFILCLVAYEKVRPNLNCLFSESAAETWSPQSRFTCEFLVSLPQQPVHSGPWVQQVSFTTHMIPPSSSLYLLCFSTVHWSVSISPASWHFSETSPPVCFASKMNCQILKHIHTSKSWQRCDDVTVMSNDKIYTFIHDKVCAHTCTHVCMNACVYVDTLRNTHTQTCTHTHTHTHKHAHTHTHTHTHTRAYSRDKFHTHISTIMMNRMHMLVKLWQNIYTNPFSDNKTCTVITRNVHKPF